MNRRSLLRLFGAAPLASVIPAVEPVLERAPRDVAAPTLDMPNEAVELLGLGDPINVGEFKRLLADMGIGSRP